jgi:transposase-like protein
MLAVRWYLRYGLSYRDVAELLAERGITVDHVTIYRWVQRFTPELIDAARPSRHVAGDRWFVDETYLKVAGQWVYLYRAIDQHGQVVDVLAAPKRDLAATRRFFARVTNRSSEFVVSAAPYLRSLAHRVRRPGSVSWPSPPTPAALRAAWRAAPSLSSRGRSAIRAGVPPPPPDLTVPYRGC